MSKIDSDWDVIIIGSGFAGLAVAIRLSCAGKSVLVLEKNKFIGGRARELKIGNYIFDAGPTVLTGIHLFNELFELSGESMSDFLDLVPIDPYYRVFDDAGKIIDFYQDPKKIIDQISHFSFDDGHKADLYFKHVSKLYKTFYPYTERNMSNFRVMLTMLPFLIVNQGNKSIRKTVNKYFKNTSIRQAMEFHPLLVGGDPKNTPALYSLIEEFERQTGVYYSVGGTNQLIKSLEGLLIKNGGEIKLASEVQNIICDHKQVTGVTLNDGTRLNSKVIISNADPDHTYNDLVGSDAENPFLRISKFIRWKFQKPSMSLYVFYFGMDTNWTETDLLHHSIIFTGHPYEALNRVFSKQKNLAHGDPSYFMYVHMPTQTDSTIAPEGCDSLYVLIAAPPLFENSKIEDKDDVREKVLDILDKYLPDIKSHIVTSEAIDPTYFRDVLNSPFGSAFSAQPTLFQSAWFRSHNESTRLKGLYFVGAGTHPGAGVPAVLSSAKITEKLVNKYLEKVSFSKSEVN